MLPWSQRLSFILDWQILRRESLLIFFLLARSAWPGSSFDQHFASQISKWKKIILKENLWDQGREMHKLPRYQRRELSCINFIHKSTLHVQLVCKDLTHSQCETNQPRMCKGTDFRFGKNAKFLVALCSEQEEFFSFFCSF